MLLYMYSFFLQKIDNVFLEYSGIQSRNRKILDITPELRLLPFIGLVPIPPPKKKEQKIYKSGFGRSGVKTDKDIEAPPPPWDVVPRSEITCVVCSAPLASRCFEVFFSHLCPRLCRFLVI